jgi:hypothetical protein
MALAFMLVSLLSLPFGILRVEAVTVTVPDDYSTIQEAIDHANDGDTIFVRNGRFYDHGGVMLKKPLTIIGENRIDTVIEQLSVSGFEDVYLTNVCVNHLDVRNSTSVWAKGCRFPEVYVGSGARLLLSQSEAWKVHSYDKGVILGFYDLPFLGRVVFTLPFGFIFYTFPLLLILAGATVLVLLYVFRKKRANRVEHVTPRTNN